MPKSVIDAYPLLQKLQTKSEEREIVLSKGYRYVLFIHTLDYLFWFKLLKSFLTQPEAIFKKYDHEMQLPVENGKSKNIIQHLMEQYSQCNRDDLKLFLSPVSAKFVLFMLQTYKESCGDDNSFVGVKSERYLQRLNHVKEDLNRWTIFSSK